jgi:hypothetical protein
MAKPYNDDGVADDGKRMLLLMLIMMKHVGHDADEQNDAHVHGRMIHDILHDILHDNS